MTADLIRAVAFLVGCVLLLSVMAYDVWCLGREAIERLRRAGRWIDQEIADLELRRGQVDPAQNSTTRGDATGMADEAAPARTEERP
jgi:hypothetical protein